MKKKIKAINDRMDRHRDLMTSFNSKLYQIELQLEKIKKDSCAPIVVGMDYVTKEPVNTKPKRQQYDTGTNAELRNIIARLRKELSLYRAREFESQMGFMQFVNKGGIKPESNSRSKDDVIVKLNSELIDAQIELVRLRDYAAGLEQQLAAPAVDTKGYEDAFIDGIWYSKRYPSQVSQLSDDELRAEYHHDAVQKAVFPDTINV